MMMRRVSARQKGRCGRHRASKGRRCNEQRASRQNVVRPDAFITVDYRRVGTGEALQNR